MSLTTLDPAPPVAQAERPWCRPPRQRTLEVGPHAGRSHREHPRPAASKHGATTEIADAIAQRLAELGHAVERTEPDDVQDLDGTDAVVLGSAVYAGQWMKPARHLLDRLGEELTGRPLWLFSSGPVGEPLMPAEEPAIAGEVMATTGAREHRVFAGRIEMHRLSFGERALVRALHAARGDFRDLGEVADWATSIDSQLRELGDPPRT